jgi:RNA polymerase sigma-70 factor (ECF subfamily)
MSNDPLHIFEVLAKQHEAMLLAYVSAIVPDRGLAEDVAQQSFVIAWRKLDQLQDPAAFPAWLRGIARLEAMNALRRAARETPVEPEALAQLEEAFHGFETARPAETWEERFRHLHACFEELPEPLRDVCRRHYFEDAKAREIAAALEASLAAVLKRLERARAALRDCIRRRLAAEPA